MKNTAIAAAAGLALLSSAAIAQDLVIAPEQRTVIREYVTKERVAPVRTQERLAVGVTVPADVELAPVPETWGPTVRRYRYVYSGDRVLLVEPSSRRIVEVID